MKPIFKMKAGNMIGNIYCCFLMSGKRVVGYIMDSESSENL